MRHVTRTNATCHTYELRHYTRINASCQKRKCVMSRVWMGNVTHINTSHVPVLVAVGPAVVAAVAALTGT